MMAECAAAGISPLQFWSMTQREIYAVFVGGNIKARRDHKLQIFGAWHGQNMARGKRSPDLKQLLRQIDPPRVMSPKAIRAAVIGMAKAMGAIVVHKKRE